MSRNLWVGFIVVIVVILTGWYLTRPRQQMTPTPVAESTPAAATSSSASPSAVAAKNVVTVSATGFSPKDITIKVGDIVTWMNTDSANHNVNSAPHPAHTAYPLLNLGVIKPGENKSLTFPTAGTYKYHDHLNPSLTGSVTVQ